MSGDLQATVKFSVEFLTFHNVDLFQRGYYQIQCTLKPPLKAATNVEVECRHEAGSRSQEYLMSADVSPSGVTAISKVFQILYKNEEVVLDDCFVFSLNMLVDSDKIVEQIDQADIQLFIELFFSDADSGPFSESLVPVVSQTIKLHMSCVKGFHHHVPLLFDYYHFAVIDINIHGTLVGLSLPDPSLVKVEGKKNWLAKSSANNRLSTPPFYVTLFSNKALSPQSSKTSILEKQLNFAYDTHRSLCSTLLSAQVNLLAYFQCLSEFLPQNQRIDLGVFDFGERLEEFSNAVEAMSSCDETFAQICSHLISISSEVELAWSQFMEFFTLNKSILPFLRKEHYQQRVAHLSEAFFVQENLWTALQIPTELSFQQHQSLSQSVKTSKYYQTIPPVLLECPALDGDNTSIPIIFEDRFSTAFKEESDDFSRTAVEEISFTLDCEDGQEKMADTNGVDEGYLNVNIISGECLEKNIQSDAVDVETATAKQNTESSSGGPDNEDLSQDNCLATKQNTESSSGGRDDEDLSQDNRLATKQNTESSSGGRDDEDLSQDNRLATKQNTESSSGGRDDEGLPQEDRSNETNLDASSSCSDITEAKRDAATLEDVKISLDIGGNPQIRESESESATVQESSAAEQLDLDPEDLNENPRTVSETKEGSEVNIVESEKESAGKEEEECRGGETVTEVVLDSNNAATDEADGTNEEAIEGEETALNDDSEQEQLTDAVEQSDLNAPEPKHLADESPRLDTGASEPGCSIDEAEELNLENLEVSTERQKREDLESTKGGASSELSQGSEATKVETEEESEEKACSSSEPKQSPSPRIDSENQTATQDTQQQKQTKTEMQSTSNEVVSLSATDSITTDSQSTSSEYETPTSSENIPSTTDRTPKTVAYQDDLAANPRRSVNVNGVTVVDSAPGSSKKAKKKSSKVVAASIYSCFPMGCGGNTSPSIGLCRMDSVYGGSASSSRFEIAKRLVKRSLNYSYQIYSDLPWEKVREPYFTAKPPESLETHLIVCVHGLDGNSGDLRLLRCYLEMALPSTRMDFLMSEINQRDTFANFEDMTRNLVQEIIHYIEAYTIYPTKLSFIGHSLGNIIIRSALTHPDMEPFLDRMHTFLSLSGPHLGMVYQTSSLVSTGLWLMQKWKKSDSLSQLSLHDNPDLRQTFIYRLSQSKGLCHFKNVLLVSSVQDHYVPYHSARMEMCRAAVKENSELAVIYREMVNNLLSPLQDKPDMNFIRYSVYHAIPNSANSLIGRAAHIAMLDSELFIEKLLLVSAVDYFR